MSAEVDGSGLILVGPPGTKKTELLFELLADRASSSTRTTSSSSRRRQGRRRPRRAKALHADGDGRARPAAGAALRPEQVRERRRPQGGLPGPRMPEVRRLPAGPGLALLLPRRQGAHALLDPSWLGGGPAVRRTKLKGWCSSGTTPPPRPSSSSASEEACGPSRPAKRPGQEGPDRRPGPALFQSPSPRGDAGKARGPEGLLQPAPRFGPLRPLQQRRRRGRRAQEDRFGGP